MLFCSVCNNMLYVSTCVDQKLCYKCNMCGKNEVINSTNESICIIDDNKVDDEILYDQYLTNYIKHDPSLPRVNNIICPNVHCTRKENEEPETIYLKYDFAQMKYLYHCCYCQYFWRNKN